jgi:tetratricopeptide (TPR) repeat protein
VVALIYAISVHLWNGDLDDAEEQIARLFSHAESYSLKSYARLGHCFQGQLDISRGDAESGVELLQTYLKDVRAARYELHTTAFNISLVQGYEAIGRFTDGIALVNETTRVAEVNGNLCYMPELLRVKAGLLLAMPQPMEDEAEACLKQSLELSRSQGARAWELRTSIDLAARLAAQGRPDRARALLEPVFGQFSEGSRSADLRTAKQLLAMWD